MNRCLARVAHLLFAGIASWVLATCLWFGQSSHRRSSKRQKSHESSFRSPATFDQPMFLWAPKTILLPPHMVLSWFCQKPRQAWLKPGDFWQLFQLRQSGSLDRSPKKYNNNNNNYYYYYYQYYYLYYYLLLTIYTTYYLLLILLTTYTTTTNYYYKLLLLLMILLLLLLLLTTSTNCFY